jgi:hypothetical protein
MKVKKAHFDRFKNSKLIAERVDIKPVKSFKQQTILKLVR